MDREEREVATNAMSFIFAIVLVVAVAFVISSAFETRNNKLLTVAKMVAAGVDPIAAGCAAGTIENMALCRGAQK